MGNKCVCALRILYVVGTKFNFLVHMRKTVPKSFYFYLLIENVKMQKVCTS